MSDLIQYTDKYTDSKNEYRIVEIPQTLALTIPKGRLLSEAECRNADITQSRGWVHVDRYSTHSGHYLMFKRPIGTNPVTGMFDAALKRKITKKLIAEQPWLFNE